MSDECDPRAGAHAVIDGEVDSGFGPVFDAFAANFDLRGEVGAAAAVYLRGRRVVHLWGGIADTRTGRPWTETTPALVFSCTKGVLAVAAYVLVEYGSLELDAPVARYWPDFARHGKESITVRSTLSHRAGLPALDRSLTRDEVLAWTPVIAAIEAQAPSWQPETAHTYHALTYGWLVGEVIRRISGESLGSFVSDGWCSHWDRVSGSSCLPTSGMPSPSCFRRCRIGTPWLRKPSPTGSRTRSSGAA